MASQNQSSHEFSQRHELIAGKVLGNLSCDELSSWAEHKPLSTEEETLVEQLQTAHTQMEQHSSPPLPESVKQRL